MITIRQLSPQTGGANSDKNQKEQKGRNGGKKGNSNENDNDRNTTGRSKKNQ